MTFFEAAVEVLRNAGRPLHYKKITEIAIKQGLLNPSGQTPGLTMGNQLNQEIRKNNGQSTVVRTRPGVFGLSAWQAPEEPAAVTEPVVIEEAPAQAAEPAEEAAEEAPRSRRRRRGRRRRSEEPAVEAAAPEAPVEAAAPAPEPVAEAAPERPRRTRRSRKPVEEAPAAEAPVAAAAEPVAAAPAASGTLEEQAAAINAATEQAIAGKLAGLGADAAEALVAQLLTAAGYVDPVVARRLDGALVWTVRQAGGLTDVNLAVGLVTDNRIVNDQDIIGLRGSLHHHGAQEGILITFGKIDASAHDEASVANVARISLVDSQRVASLMGQNGLGVQIQQVPVTRLDDAFFAALVG